VERRARGSLGCSAWAGETSWAAGSEKRRGEKQAAGGGKNWAEPESEGGRE